MNDYFDYDDYFPYDPKTMASKSGVSLYPMCEPKP